jgi:hypothetical protein
MEMCDPHLAFLTPRVGRAAAALNYFSWGDSLFIIGFRVVLVAGVSPEQDGEPICPQQTGRS